MNEGVAAASAQMFSEGLGGYGVDRTSVFSTEVSIAAAQTRKFGIRTILHPIISHQMSSAIFRRLFSSGDYVQGYALILSNTRSDGIGLFAADPSESLDSLSFIQGDGSEALEHALCVALSGST